MTEFKVKINELKNCSINEVELLHKFKKIQEQMVLVSNNELFNNNLYLEPKKQIQELMDNIKEEIYILDNMNVVLDNIVVNYLNTEKRIIEAQNKVRYASDNHNIINANNSLKTSNYKNKFLAERERMKTIIVGSSVAKANVNKFSYKEKMSAKEKATVILLLQLIDKRKDLKLTTKLKSIYTTPEALSTVLKYDDTIDKVSKELDVPKEMIQAVLFRELICYGYDDIGIDLLVKNYYIPKDIPFSDYQICEMFGLEKIQKRCRDSSTGLGQIFAKTAIDAERGINKNYDLDSNNEEDLWEMWQKLQDDKTNIYYTALVLKNEARKLNIDISNATRKEQIKIIGKYNGNIAYGKVVIDYCDNFRDFNKYNK